VEGIQNLDPQINTVVIVVIIIAMLFMFQRAGTQIVGNSFGPIMLVWFLMIGVLGTMQILNHPQILAAINPLYAFRLLTTYKDATSHPAAGFWILGAVFLCTTGAEALYSDLGHCGKQNIRVSWIFVK